MDGNSTPLVSSLEPLIPEDGGEFYVGLEMDLSEPNIDDGGRDWQFSYIRLHFKDVTADQYEIVSLGVSIMLNHPLLKQLYQLGRVLELYPTTDTNYLIRHSGQPEDHENDLTYQLTDQPRRCKFMSRDVITSTMFLTHISYGVHMGTVNLKHIITPTRCANLRPLMSVSKPKHLRSREKHSTTDTPTNITGRVQPDWDDLPSK